MMWTTIELLTIAAIMSGLSYVVGARHGFGFGFSAGTFRVLHAAKEFARCVREGEEVCTCETCTAVRKAILG